MIGCPKCKTPIRTEQFNTSEFTSCDGCDTSIQADIFDAMFRSSHAPANAGTVALDGGRAGCFFHPDNPASVPCASCGRFLCALCDVEMEGRHLCFQCLGAGKKSGKIVTLEKERVQYDRIALFLTLYPFLLLPFFILTIITAPLALFVAIRYFKTPCSILPRTKIRFISAIVLAGIQIVLWLLAIGTALT